MSPGLVSDHQKRYSGAATPLVTGEPCRGGSRATGEEYPVKPGVVVTLAAAVLLTQSGLAFAQSSLARKPGRQMTCGDFLLVDDTVKPEMVYWAATRDPRGSLVNAVIDVDATDRIVPLLVERCREAPNAPFWQMVKAETGKLERKL
jgi:acid stress chaperone HdeA